MKKIPFLNTYINNVSMDEVIQYIDMAISGKEKTYIMPINVDVVMKIEQDPYLKEIADHAGLVLADGKPLIWISKLYKRPLKEKISGSDLVPLVCKEAAEKGHRIFIVGGKDGVAVQAKKKLEKENPNIKITGVYAPPLGFEKEQEELDKINRMINDSEADMVIACLGCPKQEKWLYENYQKYNAKVTICAGATVDFLAGNVKRAPKWMSDHGLEWFYRFTQEPTRLFKRYFVDDIKIIRLVRKYR